MNLRTRERQDVLVKLLKLEEKVKVDQKNLLNEKLST